MNFFFGCKSEFVLSFGFYYCGIKLGGQYLSFSELFISVTVILYMYLAYMLIYVCLS
jgi:hypothetical protein